MSSMLRDSPTLDAEEGGEKHPEETPTGKLIVPFSKFFVFSILVFVTQEFLQILTIKGILWRKLKKCRILRWALWWGPALPLLHQEVPHHKQKC